MTGGKASTEGNIIFLLLLTSIALLVRLAWPETFLFKEDEARAWAWAISIANEGAIPAIGWTSSVGIHNSAAFPWLLALPAVFHDDPAWINSWLAFLSAAAVPLAWLLFRELGATERSARLASWLFCVSPSAIHLSRKLWDPVPLQPLGLLALILALRSLKGGGGKASFWLWPVLALTVQMHQSGLFFAVILLGYLWACRYGPGRAGWAGVGLGALLLTPWLGWLLFHAAQEWGELSSRGSVSGPDLDVLSNWLLTATGLQVFHFGSQDALSLLRWPVPGASVILQLAIAGLALPALWAGLRRVSKSARIELHLDGLRSGSSYRPQLLLAALSLGLPLVYLLAGVPGTHHYFLIILPLLCLVLSLGIEDRTLRWKALAAKALVPLWLAQWLLYFGFVMANQGAISFGIPYGRMEETGRALSRISEASQEPLRVAVSGERIAGPLPAQWKVALERGSGREVLPCAADTGKCYRVEVDFASKPVDIRIRPEGR